MSGPKTDASGQIVKAAKTPSDNLMSLIEKMKPEMARALPKHVTPERMARIVLTAVRLNPKLAECTPSSFLASVMSLAQLGLEPNTPLGYAYLIPRNNRKRRAMECTMLIGYQGMIELANRSGRVLGVYAHAVREGDEFTYQLGTERWIKHRPSDDPGREAKPITHVYAVANIRDGLPAFEVLTLAQVVARRDRSMAGDSGPWATDFEPMALKSAMRALFRWLPKSAEMARAEALEVAADTGRAILSAADETVASLLAAHGVSEADEAPEPSEPENGQGGALAASSAPAGDPAGEAEPVNEIAEVDRILKELNGTQSERNALVLKHGGDFKAILRELRGDPVEK